MQIIEDNLSNVGYFLIIFTPIETNNSIAYNEKEKITQVL